MARCCSSVSATRACTTCQGSRCRGHSPHPEFNGRGADQQPLPATREKSKVPSSTSTKLIRGMCRLDAEVDEVTLRPVAGSTATTRASSKRGIAHDLIEIEATHRKHPGPATGRLRRQWSWRNQGSGSTTCSGSSESLPSWRKTGALPVRSAREGCGLDVVEIDRVLEVDCHSNPGSSSIREPFDHGGMVFPRPRPTRKALQALAIDRHENHLAAGISRRESRCVSRADDVRRSRAAPRGNIATRQLMVPRTSWRRMVKAARSSR